MYEVFEVGSTQTDDDYIVDGLSDCVVEQKNLDPVNHFGMFLIRGNKGAG